MSINVEDSISCYLGFKPCHRDMQLLKDLFSIEIELNKYRYSESRQYVSKAFFCLLKDIRTNTLKSQ